MKKGTLFTAEDKLGNKYCYIHKGEVKQENGYNNKLFNITTNSISFVEPEWFNQRKITIE